MVSAAQLIGEFFCYFDGSLSYRHDRHLPSVALGDNAVLQQLSGNPVHRLLRVHVVLVDLP